MGGVGTLCAIAHYRADLFSNFESNKSYTVLNDIHFKSNKTAQLFEYVVFQCNFTTVQISFLMCSENFITHQKNMALFFRKTGSIILIQERIKI